MSAINAQEERNQINYAIEKFSFFTPWGASLGLLAALGASDGGNLYRVIADNGQLISGSYEFAGNEVSKSMSKLKGKLYFYESLVGVTEEISDEYKNMIILKLLYGKDGLSIDKEKKDVYTALSIMLDTLDFSMKIYGKTGSFNVNDLDTECSTIKELLQNGEENADELLDGISWERRAAYMVPLLKAEAKVMKNLSSVSIYHNSIQEVQFAGLRILYYNGILGYIDAPDIEIFFLDNGGYEVDGNTVYGGRLVNNGMELDDSFFEELTWLKKNVNTSYARWGDHIYRIKDCLR